MRGATVVHMLREAAARHPEKEAIVAGDVRLDYACLVDRIAALASDLRTRGVEGERVAVVMGNGPAIVVSMYAALEAGAHVVPLNPDYTERELAEILTDANVRLAMCGPAQHERLRALLLRLCAMQPMVLADEDFSDRRSSIGRRAPHSPPNPDALALIQYTGGTTGRSKGVMLSHKSVATNVLQREDRIPMVDGEERILCVTPLYHAYATAMALFPSLCSGGSLVILPRFKPEPVFDAIEGERITLFAGAPAIYNALVAHPEFEKRNLRSLRASFSGSAPLAVDVLERWQSVSGAPIIEGYGLTEASPILTFNPRHGVRKAGSVGKAVANTVIEIVDPRTGNGPLGVGVIGEVRARGPQLMVGYRNRPQETAGVVRDGWLYTGDLGELDADGYLYIRGRKKEMVIVGGFNVYPREIEEVLFTMSGIADCAAVGVPDSYKGEVVHAFVVRVAGASVTEEQVLAHCTRNLVRYKVPTRVMFVESLPRTSVGKVDRTHLARIACEQ